MLNLVVSARRTLLAATLLFCLPALGFGAQTGKPAPGAKPAGAAPQTGKPAAAAPASVADADKLDLNTATADQLKALPGVGDAYAKRIVDGRPYTAKNQLTSRGIVPQKTYDGIKDAVVARRPAKK